MSERSLSTPTPTSPVAPLLVSEREAARMLGVSTKTLFNRRRAGEIPYLKIGALTRYDISTLKSWIQDRIKRAGGNAT